MTAELARAFLQRDDLQKLADGELGGERRLVTVDRLAGGTRKGVYRLGLDDQTTMILYIWAAAENYWPAAAAVPGDPFTDATGAGLFAAAHAALTAAGVPTPELLLLDRSHRYLGADLALVQDAGALRLDTQLDGDPAGATATLAVLGDALRRMHTTTGPHYGKVADLTGGAAPQTRPAQDVVLDRALADLTAAAARDCRLASARARIEEHLSLLHAAVTPRRRYALVHGELGPEHVLVTPDGQPLLIDIEGLTCFDIEWEHAWLQRRFGHGYSRLNPVPTDPGRVAFYRYAQTLSLIEGPLRIAGTDFPDRQWMLDLAEANIINALGAL